VLTCALYCNSDGTLNGFGQFLADATVAVIVLGCVIGLIRYLAGQVKKW
jgi:hypothetical protein